MSLVQELADQCIEDDCGYTPLPQHVAVFKAEIRDIPKYQSALAEYLQDECVWDYLAPEILRENNDAKDSSWFTISRLTNAWLSTTLTDEVDAAIDARLGGWISDDVETVDEFGGAL